MRKSSLSAMIAAALFLLPLPLPILAREGREAPSRVRVRDDGDTVEVEAARPRARLRRVDGRGAIGVRLVDITPDLRAHFGAPKDAGALIGEVDKDCPARRAGLEVGDVVTSVDGEKVSSAWELARTVRRKEAGETLKVELVRNRTARTVQVKVEERREADLLPGELGDLRDFGRDVGGDVGRDAGRMGRELGREIRREMRARPFHFDFDTQAFSLPRRDDIRRLRDRIEDLEKRLKGLEEKRRESIGRQ
ncbi:MAG: S1C family serine protease [Thermoanaerobaculia bacterium]|nr:PDZ domain-containing protein [Acidobacteriota bacterium]